MALKPADGDFSPEALASRTEMRLRQQSAFEELCRFLAGRIVAWTWTNGAGRPILAWNDEYEDPETHERRPCARLDGDPKVIEGLEAAEIYYLLDVQQGETPKNVERGSDSSETISSGSTPAATAEKPSTSGHSRMKDK